MLPFFPRLPVLGGAAHPELSPNAVDLADTHLHVEPLLKLCLDGGAWRMRSHSIGGARERFEPLHVAVWDGPAADRGLAMGPWVRTARRRRYAIARLTGIREPLLTSPKVRPSSRAVTTCSLVIWGPYSLCMYEYAFLAPETTSSALWGKAEKRYLFRSMV